jgi:hypothetical protein
LEVVTAIITSITSSKTGLAAILHVVIVYVNPFKTDIIVFINNVIMCLMSLWMIIFSIRVSSLLLTISLWDQRKVSCYWQYHCEIKERFVVTDNITVRSKRGSLLLTISLWDQREVSCYWQYHCEIKERLVVTDNITEIKERLVVTDNITVRSKRGSLLLTISLWDQREVSCYWQYHW